MARAPASILSLVLLALLGCDATDEPKTGADEPKADADAARKQGTPPATDEPRAEAAEPKPTLPPARDCTELTRRQRQFELDEGYPVEPEKAFLAGLEDTAAICDAYSEDKRTCMFAASNYDDLTRCNLEHASTPQEKQASLDAVNAARKRNGLEPF